MTSSVKGHCPMICIYGRKPPKHYSQSPDRISNFDHPNAIPECHLLNRNILCTLKMAHNGSPILHARTWPRGVLLHVCFVSFRINIILKIYFLFQSYPYVPRELHSLLFIILNPRDQPINQPYLIEHSSF